MIPGVTSTGSKRPDALFGVGVGPEWPARMTRASGCRVWDEQGREYLDTTMALGAVALGYAHPAVEAAAVGAVRDGVVGPLPPVVESRLADALLPWVPGAEAVRFLKTGAEAMAAAVRIARVHTGRDRVITCGYHGWLDWSQGAAGVPAVVRELHGTIAFDDSADLERAFSAGPPPAAIVVEPVVERDPSREWLAALRAACDRAGTVLVFDEIKTGIRLGPGGAAQRYGGRPDLVVLGKALGNGFPIAAVLGPRDLMEAATRTWISSTLATEYVALAAAEAVLRVAAEERLETRLGAVGQQLFDGLAGLVTRHRRILRERRGIPEFCYLTFVDDQASAALARASAARGLLFKRTAYNFVSLAHGEDDVARILTVLEDAVAEVEARCS